VCDKWCGKTTARVFKGLNSIRIDGAFSSSTPKSFGKGKAVSHNEIREHG